jgi:hypothetical protein
MKTVLFIITVLKTRIQHKNMLSKTKTSWNYVRLEKPPVTQLLKNFPELYGTQMYITVFTTALH